MGMAAIGVALWKYTMKYSPENPNFFNRDRFVLSNGKHCVQLTVDAFTHADIQQATHVSSSIRSSTWSVIKT